MGGYCVNLHSGKQFARASAYRLWDDVDENNAAGKSRSCRGNMMIFGDFAKERHGA